MTWWGWVLLWTVLVLGAAGVLFLLVRGLWRSARALTHELGEVADRFGAVSDQLAGLQSPHEPHEQDLPGVRSGAAGPAHPDTPGPPGRRQRR